MLASSSRLECPLVGIEALVGVLARRVWLGIDVWAGLGGVE